MDGKADVKKEEGDVREDRSSEDILWNAAAIAAASEGVRPDQLLVLKSQQCLDRQIYFGQNVEIGQPGKHQHHKYDLRTAKLILA